MKFRQLWTVIVLVVSCGFFFWMGKSYSGSAGQVPRPLPPQAGPALARISPLPDTADHIYRFIAIGDWGAGTPFQKDVAGQINNLYQKKRFETVLMLGDNIYEDGNIQKFGKAYFTDMYTPVIQGGARFIVA